MLKDNNKSLKMPVIAGDTTNDWCQSTLKYEMRGILSILTQGKLHNTTSNIVCHEILSSLGNNKNWHLLFFTVVELLAERNFFFYSTTLILQKTSLKPITLLMDLERQILNKRVPRQNWEAVSLCTNSSNCFFPKNIFYIYMDSRTHYREREERWVFWWQLF